MKKFIILYYANDTDINASQSEVDATCMLNAIENWEYSTGYAFEPILCYPLGLRKLSHTEEIPPVYQSDVNAE